jgi:hypothetical protein
MRRRTIPQPPSKRHRLRILAQKEEKMRRIENEWKWDFGKKAVKAKGSNEYFLKVY